jgi:tRNA pseudouridine55 synthase
MLEKDKRYVARVRFGQSTNTYDAAGRVGYESRTLPDRDAVERALPRFRGALMQMPPAFSAIKRGGQKAYELARQGEPVEMEPRPVTVYALELIKWEPPFCSLDIHCSAGTYIRSIAHDLGLALNCGAHLAALRRTATGPFRIEDAVALADLQKAFAQREWRRYLLPPDAGLAEWPVVNLDEKQTKAIWNGNPIPLGDTDPAGEWGRAYNPDGHFIAIVRADMTTRQWKPHKVMSM